MKYWTIRIGVNESWVADGFNPDDEGALNMLAHALPFAHIETELYAKVIKAPNQEHVAKLQGYKSAEEMNAEK